MTFRDSANQVPLTQLDFQSALGLPRVGERVVLAGGEVGRVTDVEWHLTKSRMWGVAAEVFVDLALESVPRTV